MTIEKNPESYEEALTELEKIKFDIEEGNLSIDAMAPAILRVEFLVNYCKLRLRETESLLKRMSSSD